MKNSATRILCLSPEIVTKKLCICQLSRWHFRTRGKCSECSRYAREDLGYAEAEVRVRSALDALRDLHSQASPSVSSGFLLARVNVTEKKW